MAQITPIYSENSTFQMLETLRRKREKRHALRLFSVEGVRSINQALRYHWPIAAFVYAPKRALSDWARNILAASTADIHYELPIELFATLSGKTEPSELIALIRIPDDDPARIPIHEKLRVVVFDRPASPGNLGTLIRSCDALGVDGVIVTGHAVDVYDPETISAATGSLFAVPVVRLASQAPLMAWLTQVRTQLGACQLIGTDENGTVAIDQHDFTGATVLVVGNETWGMSASYRQACDVIVKIPMLGSASSLNVANAASIVLYEIDRQRRNQ